MISVKSAYFGSFARQQCVKYADSRPTRVHLAFMFISIEKAIELTGKSKNVLYRLMAKGHINYARCTKGKRFLEVAELKRVYGQLKSPISEQSIIEEADISGDITGNGDLPAIVAGLSLQLKQLNEKVDKQTHLLESLTGQGPLLQPPAPVAVLASRPEDDPQWPPFITCYADLAKRDEIKATYGK
jgi:hypothetical protein